MINELKTFVLLAETGSVQAVARRLPLTQPAVTRQLQRLENLLDATLLDRRAKPARLTPVGRSVLLQARKVLAAVEELKLQASSHSQPHGALRLGVVHALADAALADCLHGLGTHYPELSLQLSSGWTSELLPRVDKGELDAAVVFFAGAADALARSPGVVLAAEEIVFLASRKLSLGSRPKLEELNRIGWVLTPDGLCGSRSALRAAVERSGAQLHIAAEVHDIELQASLVERGLGIGMVPKQRAAELRRPQLRRISIPDLALRMEISLVRAPYLGGLQKAVDWLEASLAERFKAPRK
ncbi:LysR family transcriptional regulator [Variovorax sp. J2P1-59]|uniref:LysR family transcriptional regulator n=1 Tax=Variovorax flavidus TaxID=3053501 RepID=UPI00257759DA|nr:LysR family transcriptional regulator [Variovorax sp. J2P1-59]MDM0078931.1 LysR family transcriptional regulator [Variovorax sp. J2P1-59]